MRMATAADWDANAARLLRSRGKASSEAFSFGAADGGKAMRMVSATKKGVGDNFCYTDRFFQKFFLPLCLLFMSSRFWSPLLPVLVLAFVA